MNTLVGGERLGTSGHFLRFAAGLSLGALTVGAIKAMAYAESQAGLERWQPSSTKIIGLSEGESPRELVLTFPGLGSVDGEAYANCVQPLFDCPSAYVSYSSEGVDTLDIAQKLIDVAPDLKRLHINGHSMGGRHGLEVARIANKISGGQIELGKIFLHCSPYDWSDIRNKTTGNIVLLMHRAGWQGGPYSKGLVSTVKRGLDPEGFGKLSPVNWVHAFRAAMDEDVRGGCSPRAYPEDLHGFKNALLLHRHIDAYTKLAGSETRATFIGPTRAKDDRTVMTDQSSSKYGEFFRRVGIPYNELLVPGMIHADVAAACAALLRHTTRGS